MASVVLPNPLNATLYYTPIPEGEIARTGTESIMMTVEYDRKSDRLGSLNTCRKGGWCSTTWLRDLKFQVTEIRQGSLS